MVVLLGWIRAFRRELSFFTVDDRTRLQDLEDAIAELESALADGQDVEILRVEGLAKLWGLKLPEDDRRKSAASVGMEVEITARFDLGELSEIREQTETRKQEICTLAAEVLCKELGQEAIEQELIDKTCPQAAELLAVHEAWLYRDWQAAIGDLMLREIASEKRRFEVKGYADFCGMAKHDAPERGWIDLLERILRKVDVSRRDGSDARVQQLQRTLVASARILTALSKVKQRPESISNDTLRAARKVLSDLSAPRLATSDTHSVESTDKKRGK